MLLLPSLQVGGSARPGSAAWLVSPGGPSPGDLLPAAAVRVGPRSACLSLVSAALGPPAVASSQLPVQMSPDVRRVLPVLLRGRAAGSGRGSSNRKRRCERTEERSRTRSRHTFVQTCIHSRRVRASGCQAEPGASPLRSRCGASGSSLELLGPPDQLLPGQRSAEVRREQISVRRRAGSDLRLEAHLLNCSSWVSPCSIPVVLTPLVCVVRTSLGSSPDRGVSVDARPCVRPRDEPSFCSSLQSCTLEPRTWGTCLPHRGP